MSKNEPPIFGENGAVLNSDTMTDDWLEKYDAELQKHQHVPWVKISAACGMIAMPHLLTVDYLGIMGAVWLVTLVFGPFDLRQDKITLIERLLALSLGLPILMLWLSARGYLDKEHELIWFIVSSAIPLSLFITYHCAKYFSLRSKST